MISKERIKRITDEMFSESKSYRDATQTAQEPQNGVSGQEMVNYTDLYEQGRRERLNEARKQYPRGASPKVVIAFMTLLDNLRPRYKKAKKESEYLDKVGDKNRAKMARTSYMEEVFLPALESLVNLYGVDEVINSKQVLKKLDEMVLIDGGSGSGYSESFIRTLHGSERGIAPAISDGLVENYVRDIYRLVDRNEIRTAVSLAKKIKDQIERGEHSASEEDWEIISTVAMRG